MVDPALLKAVIWRESKYNASEIGGKGEIGLMQIMVDRAASDWARVKKYPLPSAGALYDPELNIEIGCAALAALAVLPCARSSHAALRR